MKILPFNENNDPGQDKITGTRFIIFNVATWRIGLNIEQSNGMYHKEPAFRVEGVLEKDIEGKETEFGINIFPKSKGVKATGDIVLCGAFEFDGMEFDSFVDLNLYVPKDMYRDLIELAYKTPGNPDLIMSFYVSLAFTKNDPAERWDHSLHSILIPDEKAPIEFQGYFLEWGNKPEGRPPRLQRYLSKCEKESSIERAPE